MYSGKQLGKAIKEAIKKKGIKQIDLAREFNITPPAITGWLNNGRVAKEHLEKLIEYFSDVVPPSHFGIQNMGLINTPTTNNHGTINGTINNVAGNQHTNNFFQHDTPIEQARATLNEQDAKFLIAMPILSVDKGVDYVIYPEKKEELIRDHAERASIYMPHTDDTFAVKVPDNSLKEIADIQANDIIVIEPRMRPANNDLVLVCLDYQQPSQRGLLAKLFVDLSNHHTIQYSNTTPAQTLPPNALICGVYTETKRRPFSNDIIASRINPDWDIFNTLQKSA